MWGDFGVGGDTIVVLSLVGKSHPVFGFSVGLESMGRGDERGEGSASAQACVEVVSWEITMGRGEK